MRVDLRNRFRALGRHDGSRHDKRIAGQGQSSAGDCEHSGDCSKPGSPRRRCARAARTTLRIHAADAHTATAATARRACVSAAYISGREHCGADPEGSTPPRVVPGARTSVRHRTPTVRSQRSTMTNRDESARMRAPARGGRIRNRRMPASCRRREEARRLAERDGRRGWLCGCHRAIRRCVSRGIPSAGRHRHGIGTRPAGRCAWVLGRGYTARRPRSHGRRGSRVSQHLRAQHDRLHATSRVGAVGVV